MGRVINRCMTVLNAKAITLSNLPTKDYRLTKSQSIDSVGYKISTKKSEMKLGLKSLFDLMRDFVLVGGDFA